MSNIEVAKWGDVLVNLSKNLPPASFEVWFRNQGISVLSWTDKKLELGVPNRFVKEWLRSHYLKELSQAVAAVVGAPEGSSPTEVNFVIIGSEYLKRRAGDGASPPSIASKPEPLGGHWADEGRLNRDFVLKDFVVGPANRLAYAACQTVVDSPSPVYNPLFLYGVAGVGKTHLLQGICHALRERRTSGRVLYISCEEFTNAFIQAIQTKRIEEFRLRFRQCDCLVVDDIYFLGTREKTQDEFFYTFDTLHNLGKQVVISSDAHPREIRSLEEKLVTRFMSGLVARIGPPGFETRVAIARQKAERRGLALPKEVLELVAAHVERNVRELEGVVTKLAALSMAEGRAPDLGMAREALKEMGFLREGPPTLEEILRAVESEFSVTAAEIRSGKRQERVSRPRQVSMYLSRLLTPHSMSEIGEFFGGRNHATVHHAERRVIEGLETEPELKAGVDRLIRSLKR